MSVFLSACPLGVTFLLERDGNFLSKSFLLKLPESQLIFFWLRGNLVFSLFFYHQTSRSRITKTPQKIFDQRKLVTGYAWHLTFLSLFFSSLELLLSVLLSAHAEKYSVFFLWDFKTGKQKCSLLMLLLA